jgi:hypothetical protein
MLHGILAVARVLYRLLDTLGISPRTGKGLLFHPVVLLHPKAIIERPAAAQFDTNMVIKAFSKSLKQANPGRCAAATI